MNRALAALAYVPLPGLGFAVAARASGDRLVRMHANQAGVLTLGLVVALLVVAALSGAARDAVAGIVGFLWLGTAGTGIIAAARGRFVRVRGAWDVAAGAYAVRMRGS